MLVEVLHAFRPSALTSITRQFLTERMPIKHLTSVLLLFLINLCNDAKAISFTANGRWGPISDMPTNSGLTNSSFCNDRFMCTPDNMTWIPDYENVIFDAKSGCERLLKKGITTILFNGDSYMRQIYAAMLITLNGDYRYGSLSNPNNSVQCEYRSQFAEKICGTLQLNHNGRVST